MPFMSNPVAVKAPQVRSSDRALASARVSASRAANPYPAIRPGPREHSLFVTNGYDNEVGPNGTDDPKWRTVVHGAAGGSGTRHKHSDVGPQEALPKIF
jgi:hypothetical protein